jgi:uncharacterized lipoprotein YddW (UPF0748 family)
MGKKHLKTRRMPKRWIALGLAALILGIALHQPAATPPAANAQETRGVWITSLALTGLHHATWLDEVLHDIRQQGINTIYPNVWSRGQTLYPSRVVPHNFTLGDVLGAIIHQSKRQNLRVIPWFEYGLKVTEDSEIARRHPDWLSRNQAGQTQINPQPRDVGPLGVNRPLSAADHVLLNPVHPQVQAMILKLLVEVVERYEVTGIQLDDHFGWPVAFGYDAYTRQRFEAEMGYPPPANPQDLSWMRWRADQLSQLMAKIHKTLKQKRPNLVISLSPNMPAYAYRETLQDWPAWVRQGYVDEVVLQAYRPTAAEVGNLLQDPEVVALRQQVPLRVGLFAGPAFAAKPAEQIAAQIRVAQAQGFDGFVLFTWEFALGPLRKGELARLSPALQPSSL